MVRGVAEHGTQLPGPALRDAPVDLAVPGVVGGGAQPRIARGMMRVRKAPTSENTATMVAATIGPTRGWSSPAQGGRERRRRELLGQRGLQPHPLWPRTAPPRVVKRDVSPQLIVLGERHEQLRPSDLGAETPTEVPEACAAEQPLDRVHLRGLAAIFAQVPLTASVTWTDARGSGAAAFQGTVTNALLRGEMKGQGNVAFVSGSVGDDGRIAGVLTSPAGGQVGTFQGVLAAGRLDGTYSVTGGSGGTWWAPAQALPVPAASSP